MLVYVSFSGFLEFAWWQERSVRTDLQTKDGTSSDSMRHKCIPCEGAFAHGSAIL